MPSIKQLKAEIQLAPIPDHHKRYIAAQISEAEERLKLKVQKPRRVSNSKGLKTLEEWEEAEGCLLNTSMFAPWIRKKLLCPILIGKMIEEFRTEMIGKGKQYADFRAAFQTYLTKGYLSRSLSNCLLANSPHRSQDETIVYNRGGAL